MLIQREEVLNDDGSLGYVECVFQSENILQTTYFADSQLLYITFSRGNTYSYEHVEEDLYERFEEAESHGKFFHKNIKNNFKNQRTYKLLPYELEGLREVVENHIPEEDEQDE